MATVRRLLKWLDRLCAPKATVDQLEFLGLTLESLKETQLKHAARIYDLSQTLDKATESNLKLRDELNALKALLRIGGQKPQNPPGPTQQKFDGSEPWKR